MKHTTKNTTKKLVYSSLMAALICVATALVKVPLPVVGYIHLGDAPVILAAFLLSPAHGFLAASIGSCLADVFLGYAIYAPVTFLIKGCMVLVVFGVQRLLGKRYKSLAVQIAAGSLAELLMVFGYWLFEGFIYDFGAALASVPFNAVQGIVGLTLGLLSLQVLRRSGALRTFDVFHTERRI